MAALPKGTPKTGKGKENATAYTCNGWKVKMLSSLVSQDQWGQNPQEGSPNIWRLNLVLGSFVHGLEKP